MIHHPALKIFDQAILECINADFEITLLDDSCAFSEGPVWNKNGFYLFSDIPENAVYRISAAGTKEVYLQSSGYTGNNSAVLSEQVGSNGLAYDESGNLLLCQHGNGAIGIWEGTELRALLPAFNGKRFNSPNDIVVHKDGSVFFSDPPYGLKEQQLNSELAQSKAGLYCFRNDKVKLFYDQFQFPNGVCLSPDQKYLYACSTKPFEKQVLVFDVTSLQLIKVLAEENSDGIKCDLFGNLYLCTKEGILVLNNEGRRLGLLTLDTQPANIAWGGSSGRDLLVTARQNIFLIRNFAKDH